MDYVNKKTGEVYSAEQVTLSNLCDGDLDYYFGCELQELVDKMEPGDKGSIAIAVKVYKKVDKLGETDIQMEASISTKYPKYILADNREKRIADGKVIARTEKNMFSE